MATILYEHPLNERIRSYLKLEQLFTQVFSCTPDKIIDDHHVFFSALFSIIDTLERSDIRGELIKDVEKLEQNLVIWSRSPEINSAAIEDNLQQSVQLICQLKGNNPTWLQLKDDKLLTSLKQRYAIQGGTASFDLPQLHFWLHQSVDTIANDIKRWLLLLDQIRHALFLILKFIRERVGFEKIETDSGFYQDSGEGIVLLRIKVDSEVQHYPSVSGNRFRYSIRFMLPCESSGRRYSNQPAKFELARC